MSMPHRFQQADWVGRLQLNQPVRDYRPVKLNRRLRMILKTSLYVQNFDQLI